MNQVVTITILTISFNAPLKKIGFVRVSDKVFYAFFEDGRGNKKERADFDDMVIRLDDPPLVTSMARSYIPQARSLVPDCRA